MDHDHTKIELIKFEKCYTAMKKTIGSSQSSKYQEGWIKTTKHNFALCLHVSKNKFWYFWKVNLSLKNGVSSVTKK